MCVYVYITYTYIYIIYMYMYGWVILHTNGDSADPK